eukprot:scaffold422980_cov31-Prasinocladus_malaysianus.AAC.1
MGGPEAQGAAAHAAISQPEPRQQSQHIQGALTPGSQPVKQESSMPETSQKGRRARHQPDTSLDSRSVPRRKRCILNLTPGSRFGGEIIKAQKRADSRAVMIMYQALFGESESYTYS